MHLPKLIAHRGASQYAPENTLVALRKAAEMGARWVEFDVQLSKDKHAVVIHDDELTRLTGKPGYVYQHTFKALQAMDVGSHFSQQFRGEGVPSLEQWLQVACGLGLSLNIELKPAKIAHHEALIEQVILCLELFWPRSLDELLVSSFDHDCLAKFHAAMPEVPIGCLFHEWQDDWKTVADDLSAASVNMNVAILTDARIQEVTEAGYSLLSYTVNDAKKANALIEAGVTGVFSDDPALFF
ncbi:MAG: glycerophosphoryl diester phosphodiesterase [Gammaproteobacteria bacterium CG11_big_fil_rev_8_21_14_0_20_46_22]|nr:MAG: glycerophosphoryl diester phosphodiesterase [Gammaproteobacteria bacterium CG12_big_fil_rev_8_21_14_0_65_46_12]PIR11609.1 MAG: glycerophosphoryl diester phosphodiesterase [Gammaproteobacteria bacterium CG11_big_fil_rev_8_21_14_0_20_46_22]